MRKRHSAAGSPARHPVTIETMERYLDRLAGIIDKAGNRGAVYLPIYERLEIELEKLKAKDALMGCVRARLSDKLGAPSTGQ
jgi:hypothetical protein